MNGKIKFQKYDILAIARGQETVYYKEFEESEKEYGEWLLIAYDNNSGKYFLYKGHHSNIISDDELLYWLYDYDNSVAIDNVYDDEGKFCYKLISQEKAREFVDNVLECKRYKETEPFLIIDKNIMLKLINDKRVGEILPINFRVYFDYYSEKEKIIYREIENAIKNHLKLKDKRNQINNSQN
jgi:hypothetical protein